jgi:flagellar biosynthetic protein FliP
MSKLLRIAALALLACSASLMWLPAHAMVQSTGTEAASPAAPGQPDPAVMPTADNLYLQADEEPAVGAETLPPPVVANDKHPHAARASAPRKSGSRAAAPDQTALALRIVLGLTLLALLPAMLVSVTAFLRIIIVLSMLRHAIGMQETPPNTVLIGLALFLTLFTMSPVLQKINEDAVQPFLHARVSMEAAYDKGVQPLREFLLHQTREQDVALMVELSKAPPPASMAEVGNLQLIPAYMLSELRAAFQIGFVIFLPFLLIDLIVSSILMGLGMMMMPPVSISLPVKILMFILVDGWSLVLKALLGSFH